MEYKKYAHMEWLMEDEDTLFNALWSAVEDIGKHKKMVIQYLLGEHLFKTFAEGKVCVKLYTESYSPVLTNPTYIEMFVLVNDQLIEEYNGDTSETDHLALESIDLEKEENGIKYYTVFLGS